MANPKPNMSGLRPGLNPRLRETRALEPLEPFEVSAPVRVRTSKETVRRLKAMSPKEIGALLEPGLADSAPEEQPNQRG